MNFHEAESYLFSLGNEVEAMKLGLDNIRKLLAALGDPQNNYLKAQVAGTNGKGSVCAFLKSICLEAGINAGVFTSPHLISITERINIGGVDIREDEFARLATKVREMSERLAPNGEIDGNPTFFEQVTAIALLAFADAKVEVAILETGLGGRLDATTAANAEITAITRIDIDHQQYLGKTLTEIAAEKAAIIRPDSIVVVAEQSVEPSRVIVDHCKKVGVTPQYGDFVGVREDEGGLTLATDLAEYNIGTLGPPGRHQIENAKVALLVAEELARRFTFLQSDIILGLRNARHPGRLEFVGNVLLDGAHNVGGAIALTAFLDEYVDKPVTLIFGAMDDKDVGEMLAILVSRADKVILTRPDNSRAMPTSELLDQIPKTFDRKKIALSESVADAFVAVREISAANDLIVVAGSLYLVGEAKRILNN